MWGALDSGTHLVEALGTIYCICFLSVPTIFFPQWWVASSEPWTYSIRYVVLSIWCIFYILPFIKTSCISSRMFLIWVTLHSCVTLSRYITLATRITHHVLAWGTTCICVYMEAGFSVRYLSPPLPTLDVEVGSQLIQNITYELVKLSSMSWHSPVSTSKMIRYIWSTILFWHLHRHWEFEVRPFSLDGKCFTP